VALQRLSGAPILARVRVIAGTAKGIRLAPVPSGVRPVSDRAREGVFSSLGERVDGARVLDLFAGTGALAIEALSRGAADAVLVEQAPRAIATVRENLRRTRTGDRARLVRADARRFLERAVAERPFDLVFVDPPYAAAPPALAAVLERLRPVLAPGATVVLTRDSRSSTDVIPLDWRVAKRLTYGDSVITLIRDLPGTTEV
jgi:16S rRNA (guanine966-N2)-methyltransferase